MVVFKKMLAGVMKKTYLGFVRINFDGDCVWSQILTWFAKAE